MADQRKLYQNVGLENMNMTSNYDVTNMAHQIQMTPYATELTPIKSFCVRHWQQVMFAACGRMSSQSKDFCSGGGKWPWLDRKVRRSEAIPPSKRFKKERFQDKHKGSLTS